MSGPREVLGVHQIGFSLERVLQGAPRDFRPAPGAAVLARLGGHGRFHRRGVALIAAAKEEGLPVTAEVTPHHLLFDHSYVEEMNPIFKMMPPLRSTSDVAAVREGLESGVIDVVSTDHAPHADHEKDHPWEDAPFGVIGLEWAAAVVNTVLGLDPAAFFRVMSSRPAEIGEIAAQGKLEIGAPANLVVFDPDAVADKATFAEPHQYAAGVRHVFVNGEQVVRDGEHTGALPGRVVRGPGYEAAAG